MKTVTQIVVLKSRGHFGKKPLAGALGEVLRLIPTAVAYSVRMAFEGRSSPRGARPAWLEAATDARFIDHIGADETTLIFELPQLGEAAPQLYGQQEIWPTRPDPNDTGFDLLADVIGDLDGGDEDSEKFDNPLLRRIGHFEHALNGTFSALDIITRRHPAAAPAAITTTVIETAKRFTNTTPPAQAVRIYGQLDMIRASTQSFALKLTSGEEVRGALDGFDAAELGTLFRKYVLVLGKAVYRPSGRLLRVDAMEIRMAEESERSFSHVPVARASKLDVQLAQRLQQHRGGIAAVFGKWPGDESEGALLKALEEMD